MRFFLIALFAFANLIKLALGHGLLLADLPQQLVAVSGGPPEVRNLVPLPADAPPADALYPVQEDVALSQGYGAPPSGSERVDEPVRELPTTEETQEGQVQVFDHALPDTVKDNRIDLNKEIHSYSVQRKIININQRNVHRYFKNLNVNTLYNTNIQRVKHNKLQNVLVTTVQDKHEPTLLVKYTRTDTAQQLPDVLTPPIVENVRQDQVLPPVVEPARVEKLDYNGQLLSQGPAAVLAPGPAIAVGEAPAAAVPVVAAMADASQQADAGKLQQLFPSLFSNTGGDASATASLQQPLMRAVRENLDANRQAASKGLKTFSLISKKA